MSGDKTDAEISEHPAIKSAGWVHLCKMDVVERDCRKTTREQRMIFVAGYEAGISSVRSRTCGDDTSAGCGKPIQVPDDAAPKGVGFYLCDRCVV